MPVFTQEADGDLTKSGIASPEAVEGKLENMQTYKIAGYKKSVPLTRAQTPDMHAAVNFKWSKKINEFSIKLNMLDSEEIPGDWNVAEINALF